MSELNKVDVFYSFFIFTTVPPFIAASYLLDNVDFQCIETEVSVKNLYALRFVVLGCFSSFCFLVLPKLFFMFTFFLLFFNFTFFFS